jgi:hypothetical protein
MTVAETPTTPAATTPAATQAELTKAATTKRRLLQPGFWAATVVLAIAAVGLNAATQFMQLHFKKLAVEIAKPVKEIPAELGPWKQVTKDEPLDSDLEAALATKEYVFRNYVDERRAGKSTVAEFNEKIKDNVTGEMRSLTNEERVVLLLKLQAREPQAVVNLAVTYYTGLVDTVAHIPDRCYIADGYVPSEYETVKWSTGKKASDPPTEVRFINFEDQAGERTVPRSVAYFFRVNDTYTSDPLAVRRRLQNLREKYGFYSKVELMMMIPTGERSASATAMTDFLGYALPEIEKCFPDWEKLNGRTR